MIERLRRLLGPSKEVLDELNFLRGVKEGLAQKNAIEKARVTCLQNTIRDMDQLIYQMNQRRDWGSMRPHFAKLLEGTERRMRIESDRISDMIQKQLRKAHD